jgi:hypothetical protein
MAGVYFGVEKIGLIIDPAVTCYLLICLLKEKHLTPTEKTQTFLGRHSGELQFL